MNAPLEAIAAEQLGAGLPGLAGSAAHVTMRVADALVNQILAATLPPDAPVRTVSIAARAGNAVDVSVTPKAALLPRVHARLEIDKQAILPGDPVLALRVTGGAGMLLGLASSFLTASLPPGVRIEGGHVLVDVRAMAAAHGQSSHLRYARTLHVAVDEGVFVITIDAAV
jgi:hypothetical protein